MRSWAQRAARPIASRLLSETGRPLAWPPQFHAERAGRIRPAAAAAGLAAVLAITCAGAAVGAPLGTPVSAGEAQASAAGLAADAGSGPALVGGCDGALAVLGLAVVSCAGSATAMVTPATAARSWAGQRAAVSGPAVTHERPPAAAQAATGLRMEPACGCQSPAPGPMPTATTPTKARPLPIPTRTAPVDTPSPSGIPTASRPIPAPTRTVPAGTPTPTVTPSDKTAPPPPVVTATGGPTVAPTPSSAAPVAHRPAMAAKSAFRLIGSSPTQLPGMHRDPGGVSPDRAVAARRGTLPTTGLDLEGLAAAGIGFLMAGGGGLLAAGRPRRRHRNG